MRKWSANYKFEWYFVTTLLLSFLRKRGGMDELNLMPTCQLSQAINGWMDDNPLVSHRIQCIGIVVGGAPWNETFRRHEKAWLPVLHTWAPVSGIWSQAIFERTNNMWHQVAGAVTSPQEWCGKGVSGIIHPSRQPLFLETQSQLISFFFQGTGVIFKMSAVWRSACQC